MFNADGPEERQAAEDEIQRQSERNRELDEQRADEKRDEVPYSPFDSIDVERAP